MSTPEEQRDIRDRVLADFFTQALGADIVSRIPTLKRDDVVRLLLDHMGVDGMLEAISPAFRQALCTKLPGKPKTFKREHAMQTGIDVAGKPIFALQERGNRSRTH